MTTPNPWERLREAARNYRTMVRPQHGDSCECMPACAELDEALAALPPAQTDAEREKAVWAAISRLRTADRREDWHESRGAQDEIVALMRYAPAQQPASEEPKPLSIGGVLIATDGALDHNWPPKPASPASDWRERFDDDANLPSLNHGTHIMLNALRDGLAAVEDRLAQIESKERP